jgi:succinate dehydrogenase/fumarate reductase-like Fe-S protein
VLRELVVDMEMFFEQFDRARAWLVPNPDYAGVPSAEDASKLWPAVSRVECGICASGQSDNGALYAAGVARVLGLSRDPRDAVGRARLSGLGVRSDRAFAERLKAVCPKDVGVSGLPE